MNQATKRMVRDVESRAFDIRSDYYGGKMDWDDAVSLLRNMFCEFMVGSGAARRLEATAMAINYLEPDV